MKKMECPFCSREESSEVILENSFAYAILDRYPVSRGHTLIIPKHHISSYFELTFEEQSKLWEVVNSCKVILDQRYNPDGYNIGVNIGEAAGQSIFHLHIHLIPRFYGDMDNPKGGVRGVIPEKQAY